MIKVLWDILEEMKKCNDEEITIEQMEDNLLKIFSKEKIKTKEKEFKKSVDEYFTPDFALQKTYEIYHILKNTHWDLKIIFGENFTTLSVKWDDGHSFKIKMFLNKNLTVVYVRIPGEKEFIEKLTYTQVIKKINEINEVASMMREMI